jgi:hypothetical protein
VNIDARKKANRQLIIRGRFMLSILNDPERRTSAKQLDVWFERFLTKNSDRKLFGFAPLDASPQNPDRDGDNHDQN